MILKAVSVAPGAVQDLFSGPWLWPVDAYIAGEENSPGRPPDQTTVKHRKVAHHRQQDQAPKMPRVTCNPPSQQPPSMPRPTVY